VLASLRADFVLRRLRGRARHHKASQEISISRGDARFMKLAVFWPDGVQMSSTESEPAGTPIIRIGNDSHIPLYLCPISHLLTETYRPPTIFNRSLLPLARRTAGV
jgi:hypothetical protein